MSNRYAAERGSPGYPACGQSLLHLLFDGTYLHIAGTPHGRIFPAVSGRPVESGKFSYAKERQAISDVGPIPEGDYWIQPSQLQENAWYRVRNPRFAWGDYWITIHPYPSTKTYGRGGFFIHGGANPGSAGCIDLTIHMDQFVQMLKDALHGLPACFIPLSVRYAK